MQQHISVLVYTTNQYRQIECSPSDTSESICHKLCRDLNLTPATTLLFALRHAETGEFLPGNRAVVLNEKYEFRLRFQMKEPETLERTDRNAFDYFYQQVKCDLIANKIRGLEYPFSKEKVAGLCVTNMYIDMLEKNMTPAELNSNYRKYFPAKLIKKHPVFLQKCVMRQLNVLQQQNTPRDSYKVRGTVLKSVQDMVNDFMVEQCSGKALYMNDVEPTSVRLNFDPHHTKTPGLVVQYVSKQKEAHVCRLEDIFTIVIENDSVLFEIRNKPTGFTVAIPSKTARESFVSGICGYYRLMVRWTVNLCPALNSPHLEMLSRLKCHGPIGGEFAYTKLQDNHNTPGSYILRECEREFDIYNIDIVASGNNPQTFKITHSYKMWHWHSHNSDIKSYSNLMELANGIPSNFRKKVLLSPSEFDNSPLLLLCRPPSEWTVKKSLNEVSESEMRLHKTQILNPTTDLRKYIRTLVKTDNGIIGQMKADWILPDDKKLEVTLKILEKDTYQREFLALAETWSNLFAPELIKMYGFTLSSPQMFIIESIRMGPLDEFLRNARQPLNAVCLIDASYSLARALHYLQENHIVHGHIRCSKLHVVKFQSPNQLVVRLGDPGFQNGFSKDDIPWIPVEYSNREKPRLDFKAEIWAFATTLWEIFSRGRTPSVQDFIKAKRRLPPPLDCPSDMYNIMLEGWDTVPERRFTPQMIFPRLIAARDACRNAQTGHGMTNGSKISVSSEESQSTERTTVSEHSNLDNESTYSEGSTNSEQSTDDFLDFGPSKVEARIDLSNPTTQTTVNTESEFGISILELPEEGYRVVLQGEIGHGHFGVVYRGQMEDSSFKVEKVAVKRFKEIGNDPSQKTIAEDFKREITIMQKLEHKNIVKIISYLVEPMSIIMEYVEHRSFLMYLNSKAPVLTNRQLFEFSKDIARGMEYLGSMKIVHRDLAARNVLVAHDECVKISDFGLAQSVNSDGYYMTQNRSRELPMRWYAPEAFDHKYSFMSDVWSYGVTLFEIFSRGCQPNLVPEQVLSQFDMFKRLENGERLPRPQMCPINVYNTIMMRCWDFKPKSRPTFTQILKNLDNCIAEIDRVI